MARAAAATRSCSPPRCASRSPTPAARASRPTASARPATPACGGSASTTSTSTRCTRPIPDVPLEETLEALDGLVQAGKVRALGASNYPAWLLAWAVALQDRHGWSPFVSLQPQYSLVERSIEIELLPFCRAAGLGRDPVGAARRRLPDRPLLARRAAAGGLAHGRRRRRPRGGAGAARDRAQLPRRRRGAGDRRGEGRDDLAGLARVAAGDRGRDRPDRRAAHVRAARGPARRGRRVAHARRSTSGSAPTPRRPRSIPTACCSEQSGIDVVVPLRR